MEKFKTKFSTFFRQNRERIIKIGIMLLAIVAISLISLVLLMIFGVVYFEDGLKFDLDLFNTYKSSWYGWIIFVLLQTGLSILLCIIPGAAMAFILLSKAIYPVPWQAFLFSFISVMISSTVMYGIGRSGGYKICELLLGKEDCKKSLTLLRDKGTVFFPLMMMFPIFPDDALVMIAGTLRMKLKWFVPSIIIGRGVGIATIVFGLSLTSYLKEPWQKILFGIFAVIAVILVFFFANKFNRYLERRRNESGNPSDSDTITRDVETTENIQ